MNVCDLEFQGQPSRSRIVFNTFDILDIENVIIDTKINFVSRLQPEIWKVMQKGVWPWFLRLCNKDRIFSLSPLDSLTPKTYPWEIFSKNSDGKAKIQGGGIHPPLLGVFGWRNTLGIRGLIYGHLSRILSRLLSSYHWNCSRNKSNRTFSLYNICEWHCCMTFWRNLQSVNYSLTT